MNRPDFTRGLFVLSASAVVIGCDPSPLQHDDEVVSVVSGLVAYPELGFEPRPSYLANNVIALSFDDGPDALNTPQVLDILKQKAVKASFFINTVNMGDVNSSAPLKAIVRRIVAEGHELGNHTVRHADLETLTPSAIEADITGVQETIRRPDVLGAAAPRLTLLRAPFGRPYQRNDPGLPSALRDKVAPMVAKYAVHVGWNISVHDFTSCADRVCVENNFKNDVKTVGAGAYGIVLLHSVTPHTVQALPAIIDHCRANGFVFQTVEDVVRARFGRSSAALVDNPGSWTTDGGRPTGFDGGAADSSGTAADAGVMTAADAAADAENRNGAGGSGGSTGAGGSAGRGEGAGGSSGTTGSAGGAGSSGSTGRASGGSGGGTSPGSIGQPASAERDRVFGGCSFAGF
jgi:peptidoglycan/xylan/chitin deacetylase (PgdA/CDA1 family)